MSLVRPRPAPRTFLVVLTALVLAGSGCVGSSGSTDSTPPTLTQAPDAAFDADSGAIEGTVVDDQAQPVGGAILQLQPGDLSATTALDGSFSFSNVPPGSYNVFVAKLGYESKALKASVVTGEVATLIVTLTPIAIATPHVEVLGPFTGYMQCRMSTPLSSGACGFLPLVGNTTLTSIWTNDKVIWNFGHLSGEDWSQIVFESKWQASQAATNPKMMQAFSYDGRPGTHWWADSGGQDSPIMFVYDKEDGGPGGQIPGGTPKEHQEPTPKHLLRTWLTLPFAAATQPVELAIELRFQMMVTIYYQQDAPEGYSAFPDE